MPSYGFAPAARLEIREIVEHIKTDDKAAAERWFTRLQEKCGTLAASPRIGRVREDLLPGAFMFPFGNYLIFYDIVQGGVQIVHIAHGARDVHHAISHD